MRVKCKEKESLTSCYIQNCGHVMPRASINSKSKKQNLKNIDPMHICCSKALSFHFHDGCFKNILAHKLVSPNNWIEKCELNNCDQPYEKQVFPYHY